MLQSTEYHEAPYLAWYWRTQDFSKVAKRRQLRRTRAAQLLLAAVSFGMAVQVAVGLALIALWYWHGFVGGWAFGLALIVSYPVVWAHLILAPLFLGRLLIAGPRERMAVIASERVFKDHSGAKIAIAGSYGKTSMKELLLTVLSEGKRVAATPANKNVSISHAQFAQSLTGNEDILLIEYGEGAPGDVARFARRTHPTHAVITGVAAAHLDRYKTVAAAGQDIFSIAAALPSEDTCYVNGESVAAEPFIHASFHRYDRAGALGWRVDDVVSNMTGIRFSLKKGKYTLRLTSGLLGKHQLGPLSLAAALAHEFGLTPEEITAGIAKTQPFEHRMQPYRLGGAWIIDDTYNGNIEGIRAGTELLRELRAKRKMYVTPGLVDQGKVTIDIHKEMGSLIAASGANVVVLMKNSVTPYIQEGLAAGGFTGEIRIEPNPLEFYTNLPHFVSAGDVVLMQNDWPDNYA
jgi:UDP-N-acetylmuramoyl-tripeptide--D-alanyl-D-alanine ligase